MHNLLLDPTEISPNRGILNRGLTVYNCLRKRIFIVGENFVCIEGILPIGH